MNRNEDVNTLYEELLDYYDSIGLSAGYLEFKINKMMEEKKCSREEAIKNLYTQKFPSIIRPKRRTTNVKVEREGDETSTAVYLRMSFILLILGVLLLNKHYVYMSLIPMIFTLFCVLFNTPDEITVQKELSKVKCRVDDIVEIKVRLIVKKGIGFIIVRDVVPKDFELVKGSNVRALFKGLKPLKMTITYSVKCSLKGIYEIPPTEIETIHILGFKKNKYFEFRHEGKITVLPLAFSIRRIRMVPTRSSIPIPMTAISRRGSITTDFREIRKYVYGDPVKFINWKATARTGSKIPLVNEFERESKKTIMIFLDTTTNMKYGTTLKNPLEYGVSAVASLSYYLLNRSFNVGVVVYGNEISISPRTGGDQYYRILRKLITLKTFSNRVSFERSVELNRRWIIECTPLVFIITNITRYNINELIIGIKKIIQYLGRSVERSKKTPVIILDISPLYISANKYKYSNLVVEMADLEKVSLYKLLQRLGVTIIKWEVGRKSLVSAMTPLLRLIK